MHQPKIYLKTAAVNTYPSKAKTRKTKHSHLMLFCFILHTAYFLSGNFRGTSLDSSSGPDTMSCTTVKSCFQSRSSSVQALTRGTQHGNAWNKHMYDRSRTFCIWCKCVNMHLVRVSTVTQSQAGSGGEHKPVNLRAFFS